MAEGGGGGEGEGKTLPSVDHVPLRGVVVKRVKNVSRIQDF